MSATALESTAVHAPATQASSSPHVDEQSLVTAVHVGPIMPTMHASLPSHRPAHVPTPLATKCVLQSLAPGSRLVARATRSSVKRWPAPSSLPSAMYAIAGRPAPSITSEL